MGKKQMKLGIMQPYFLPYLGYFQLISLVDEFCLLENVNYIKKGWINRNKVLVQQREFWITIPLKDASQNKKINELEINNITNWQNKMVKTVSENYSRYQSKKEGVEIVNFLLEGAEGNLSAFLGQTLKKIGSVLGTKTILSSSSSLRPEVTAQDGQGKIINICKEKNAKTYVNAPGGKNLYNYEEFENENLDLCFLKPFYFKEFEHTEMNLSILHFFCKYGLKKVKEAVSAGKIEAK